MEKASRSGLFELWGGWVVESDGWSPSTIKMFLIGVYPTSEAFQAACESPRCAGLEYSEGRLPAAYIARHQEVRRRKEARRLAAWVDEAPF